MPHWHHATNRIGKSRICNGTLAATLAATLAGLLSLSVIPGCAGWYGISDSTTKKPTGLPAPKMAADTVIMDVVFLRLPEASHSQLEAAWQQTNEQLIDIDLRRQLDRNGIRCGIVSGEIPIQIQKWLDFSSRRSKDDLLEQADLNADVSSQMQRFQCRSGKRKEVIVHPEKAGSVAIFHHDGSAKGKSYDSPSMLFGLTTFAEGDGTASVKITPEILYGPMVAKFRGKDYGIRKELRRSEESWDHLSVQTRIRPGDLIVMGGTHEKRGLGEHFFWTETVDGSQERILMLARLSQTQLDDILDPEKVEQARREAESP